MYAMALPEFSSNKSAEGNDAVVLWNNISESLNISHKSYDALEQAVWEVKPMRIFYSGSDKEDLVYGCTRQLYCELFPKLAARGMFVECDGNCWVKECVPLPWSYSVQ